MHASVILFFILLDCNDDVAMCARRCGGSEIIANNSYVWERPKPNSSVANDKVTVFYQDWKKLAHQTDDCILYLILDKIYSIRNNYLLFFFSNVYFSRYDNGKFQGLVTIYILLSNTKAINFFMCGHDFFPRVKNNNAETMQKKKNFFLKK